MELKVGFIELFKKQALENPRTIAVVSESTELTYQELDTLSDQFVNFLKTKLTSKSHVIGLCDSNDVDFIVALLGILKSGNTYLPLDPQYPKERLDYMLKDAKPTLILTKCKWMHFFEEQDCLVLNLHAKEWIDPKYAEKVCLEQDLSNVAYIIYTSGSTGVPKGIEVTYRSLPDICTSRREIYPSNMRALLSGAICFDASLLVIFYTLSNKGTLFIFEFEVFNNINKYADFIKKHLINFIISVPSLYLRLLETEERFSSLESVSLTGENLTKSLCIRHGTQMPEVYLYNEYGPTEYAIGTTIGKIYDPIDGAIRDVTVGKPLPNTEVYILDSLNHLIPYGEKGEICVTGAGLAKGYLNQEELTKEKFIEVSLAGKGKILLYRTGDLGRFLPNGELEFLGRIEYSVEISGFRINLGELEHLVCKHPKVKEIIVLKEEDQWGNPKLVVYFTTVEQGFFEDELRALLLSAFSLSQVSLFFVHIDRFPLSPNGKIDREKVRHLEFVSL